VLYVRCTCEQSVDLYLAKLLGLLTSPYAAQVDCEAILRLTSSPERSLDASSMTLPLRLLCLASQRFEEAMRLTIAVKPRATLAFAQHFCSSVRYSTHARTHARTHMHARKRTTKARCVAAQTDEWRSVLVALGDGLLEAEEQEETNGRELVEEYGKVLMHLTSIYEPDAFLLLLPPHGKMAFFLPFIEASFTRHAALALRPPHRTVDAAPQAKSY
jgi:hypothetical protein